MYRSDLNNGDRAGTVALVVLIHLGLAYAFLNLSGTMRVIQQQVSPQLIDVDIAPPPPPVVEVPLAKAKPKEKEGAASPQNIKSKATPVAAPEPRIQLPVPPPMEVAKTPNTGADPTQGAAAVAGPGTGAGGNGTGTGSGGAGSGTGGGGVGGYAEAPRLLTPVLTGRDFPRALLDQWPRRTPAFLRLRIDANGYVLQCFVDRGSGLPALDAELCRLVQGRFRFRPAIDRGGRAVAGWAGYVQPPPR